MAGSKNMTGYNRRVETVPANSMLTMDFEATPNYFKVHNQGAGTLYCSITNFPTTKVYDFAVNGGGSKLYASPHNKQRLYVYNPSGSACSIVVVTLEAEFDPAVLAFTDLQFDLAGATLETSNVVSSFTTSLPAGNNLLGKVDVTSLPALPAGSNSIGKVDVNGWANLLNTMATADKQKDYTEILNSILNTVAQSSGGAVNVKNGYFEGAVTSAGNTITLDISKAIKFNFITNDGENDVVVKLSDSEGVHNVTLKAGECLNDLETMVSSVVFSSASGSTVRALWTVKG